MAYPFVVPNRSWSDGCGVVYSLKGSIVRLTVLNSKHLTPLLLSLLATPLTIPVSPCSWCRPLKARQLCKRRWRRSSPFCYLSVQEQVRTHMLYRPVGPSTFKHSCTTRFWGGVKYGRTFCLVIRACVADGVGQRLNGHQHYSAPTAIVPAQQV